MGSRCHAGIPTAALVATVDRGLLPVERGSEQFPPSNVNRRNYEIGRG